MGKTTAQAKRKSNRGRKPKPGGRSFHTVTVKAHPDYKQWLTEFADAEGTTPSKLVERGLALLAQSQGFSPPPAR